MKDISATRASIVHVALMLLALGLAGCSQPAEVPDEPASQWTPGACDITLPDGRAATCRQEAIHGDIVGSTLGHVCSDQTLAGDGGQVTLLVSPLGGVLLQFTEIPHAASLMFWSVDEPRLWEFQEADAAHTFDLGVLPKGTEIGIEVYKHHARNVNDTFDYVWVTSNWTVVHDRPYAVHSIEVNEDTYHVAGTVAVEQEGGLRFVQADLDIMIEDKHIVAEVDHHLNARLTVGDPQPGCLLG